MSMNVYVEPPELATTFHADGMLLIPLDVAHPFRDDLAHHSGMMSPG
jgi:hypothetical protein